MAARRRSMRVRPMPVDGPTPAGDMIGRMTDLVVRRLLVDLDAPFPVDWCGGDRFRSAFFGALSMSFPVGEQFFIDSVRSGVDALPDAERDRMKDDVRAFVGQEATHRRLHGLFNAQLESQGLVNGWGPRALKRLARLEGQDPRHAVAITAAYEHLTAIMAEWMLRRPGTLVGADERLRTLWQWHAAEECEHRSVAFDVYRALDGDEAWRLRWFRRITKIFVIDATRQTIRQSRAKRRPVAVADGRRGLALPARSRRCLARTRGTVAGLSAVRLPSVRRRRVAVEALARRPRDRVRAGRRLTAVKPSRAASSRSAAESVRRSSRVPRRSAPGRRPRSCPRDARGRPPSGSRSRRPSG